MAATSFMVIRLRSSDSWLDKGGSYPLASDDEGCEFTPRVDPNEANQATQSVTPRLPLGGGDRRGRVGIGGASSKLASVLKCW